MGQKVNPTGLRIGVIKNWESRWYANEKDFANTLIEDYELREFLLKLLAPAGVPKIEIERDAKRVYVNIHCAKPGMVIGRGGAEIDKLKKLCESKLGGKEVSLNIVEIKQPDLDAQLVAENIGQESFATFKEISTLLKNDSLEMFIHLLFRICMKLC